MSTAFLTISRSRRAPHRGCGKYVGAALLALGVAACQRPADQASPPERIGVATRPVVLYVEEPRFADTAEESLNYMIKHFSQLAPDEQPDWRLITSDPALDDKLRRAILELRPRLVVLANDGLLDGVGDWANDTNFLIPSELSPEGVRGQLEALRSQKHLAFVSWNSGAHEKTLDHLGSPCGAPTRQVAAFFPKAVMDPRDRDEFLAAAARRGLRVTPVSYDGFPDFQRALRDTLRQHKPDVLYLPISPDLYQFPEEVAKLVADARIPAVYSRRDQVWKGGLIATDGPDEEVEQNLAKYALLILHGADAASLEISRPTQLQTTVNLQAAAAIGCVIPYEVLVESQRIVGR